MPKFNTSWKVHPNGGLEKLSDRVWRVESDLPGVPMKRVMTIAKRADGGLVIHNAIALDDADMAQIDAWGPVSAIVVPNGYHRLDAKVFKDRYPGARVACPTGARKKVEECLPVDATYDDVSDTALELVHLDGTKDREGAMIVREHGSTTIVFNDAVFNMPHVRGFTGFVLRRLTGSTGGPRVSNLMKWVVIKDKKAFRAHLERLAETPDLRRVIVSHHQVIDQDVAGTLREVAAGV